MMSNRKRSAGVSQIHSGERGIAAWLLRVEGEGKCGLGNKGVKIIAISM